MTKYIIREARKENAEKVLEYTKIVGGQTNNLTFGSEGLNLTVDEEENILENIYNSDKSIFLLTCLNDENIGLGNISAKTRNRMNHKAVLGISIKKEFWGQGIAQELMAKLIEFSNESGLEIIELTVRSDNERAINLYKKFGFKKTGTIPADMKIDGKYFDTDYMILNLRETNKEYEKR